jgi:adenine-specific DNA-methyltransferase
MSLMSSRSGRYARGQDAVLDPSYGGCVFLEAAIARLRQLTDGAEQRVFGVDVDPRARLHLSVLQATAQIDGLFHDVDFLTLRPADFPTLFDAIVGNPPFVRHHMMTSTMAKTARTATAWCGLPETASYWAYFVLHSMTFLRSGGRLGMVLPGAFLTADYSVKLWKQLLGKFSSIRVLLVRSSIFSDAEERCVILLADGYGGRCAAASYKIVDSFAALANEWDFVDSELEGEPVDDAPARWPMPLLTSRQRSLLEEVRALGPVATLGSLARIRIGVVTGANDFFVMSPSRMRALGLSKSLFVPIISSGRQLRTLQIGPGDIEALQDADVGSLLLTAGLRKPSAALEHYLGTTAAATARRRYKSRERSPWYVLRDSAAPDAFLTYVNHFAPRIAINKSEATSTNAVHRLWWRNGLRVDQAKLVSLSSLTSLCGLSAEIAGRGIGGGALKVEIRDAAGLLVVVSDRRMRGVSSAWDAANRALSASKWDLARSLADAFVLRTVLRLKETYVSSLRSAHDRLIAARIETAGATPRRASRQ